MTTTRRRRFTTARAVMLGAFIGAAAMLSTAATSDVAALPTDGPVADVPLTDAPTEPVGSAPTTEVTPPAPTTDAPVPTVADAPVPTVAAPTVAEVTPTTVAAPTAEVIEEDDPRWDCRVNGNRQCGFTVQGTTYVVTFVDGQPTTVTTR